MNQYSLPARITLISHPATLEQKAGVFPLDEPLDARALQDVRAAAWKAPKDARVLASPELRTRQTAEALGLDAMEAHELRECDFGRWGGCGLEMLQAEDPAGLSEWLTDVAAVPHGGESFYKLMVRTGDWLDAQKESGPAIVLTHATVIRAAVVHALEVSPHEAFFCLEIGPLTMTDIRYSGGRWRVRSVGVPLAV